MSGCRELTGEELMARLTGFERSMFRLELLQHYTVDDDRPLHAWLAGEPQPPRPEKTETVEVLRELTASGRRTGRVHLVRLPLTDYVRYELEQYRDNVAAGEDVRIAVADDRDPELRALGQDGQDFVLLDGDGRQPAVVWYDYGHDGRLRRWRLDETSTSVDRCRRWQEIAVTRSVPLVAFTATRQETEDQGR